MKYDFHAIESKWQTHWENQHTFAAHNPGDRDFDARQPKFYVLDMFPYPSGVGLHVGHPLGYIATDIVARYKRMRGYNVLHPMGFDAFGLPAEQFAVEHGVHPRITTGQNVDNMIRQLKQLGLSYDWHRCFNTTDVDYYKWTQWIFLQLYHSYVDPATGKARPIRELEQALASETIYVSAAGELVYSDAEGLDALTGSPIGAYKWHELSPEHRDAVLDNHRLAYLAEVPVNWCPALGTVLANEEVTTEGRSERGNHPVYKRPLKQWMLRITAMADRLASELDDVAWPEAIKLLQRNWIGRSTGARVDFPLTLPPGSVKDESGQTHLSESANEGALDEQIITVFTTRPDTLFGATYMVLAPEHPLVASGKDDIITDAHRDAVRAYQKEAAAMTDVDRQADAKGKSGVFTGAYALNPVNSEKIPIWIADYVMMGYGTGAIMAVPAHDDRDFAFAKAFDLPIKSVVMPDDQWLKAHAPDSAPYEQAGLSAGDLQKLRDLYIKNAGAFPEAFIGHGRNINSVNDEVSLDDLPTPAAKTTITQWLEQRGVGEAQVQYKLRDWLFSRQRYWGEPFPILHELDDDGRRTGRIRAVDATDLPVNLPNMEDFRPASGGDDADAPVSPPLSRAPEDWRYVEIDGTRYERELNTMPQWAGSCWYYLRFCDPRNDERFVGEDAERYWMSSGNKDGAPHAGGVDLYVGGVEHAVLHLLYARFWHKVLHDLGHVSTPEPFGKLFSQGYIQAYAYTDERGVYVNAEEVTEQDGKYFHDGKQVQREFGKMGKSLKNAVAPDDVCAEYGADTLRLYEMYMGPLDQSKIWNTRDIVGVHRFLQRLWRNLVDEEAGSLRVSDEAPTTELSRKLHKTIKRVTDGMETMSYNTAIAALIELNNDLVQRDTVPRPVAEAMTLLLAPMAPHIAEEFWALLGHSHSVARAAWPSYDEAMLVEGAVQLPVQINGKVRGHITIAADAADAAVEEAARADDKIAANLEGKTVRKVIVVKGRLVNIVAN